MSPPPPQCDWRITLSLKGISQWAENGTHVVYYRELHTNQANFSISVSSGRTPARGGWGPFVISPEKGQLWDNFTQLVGIQCSLTGLVLH